MEAKEFEDKVKGLVKEFVAPDGKQILKSKAMEGIPLLKGVINALADAVIKQAKEEAEKAQKDLDALQNMKV